MKFRWIGVLVHWCWLLLTRTKSIYKQENLVKSYCLYSRATLEYFELLWIQISYSYSKLSFYPLILRQHLIRNLRNFSLFPHKIPRFNLHLLNAMHVKLNFLKHFAFFAILLSCDWGLMGFKFLVESEMVRSEDFYFIVAAEFW